MNLFCLEMRQSNQLQRKCGKIAIVHSVYVNKIEGFVYRLRKLH